MKAYLFVGEESCHQGTYLIFEDGYLLPVWLQEVLRKGEDALDSLESFTAALIEHCPTKVGVALKSPENRPGETEDLGRLDLWWEHHLIMHPHGTQGFNFETYSGLDLSDLQKKHAHWSDPVWNLPQELQWFYFGHGEPPQEALDRWEITASRTGLATAWLLYWVEVEFGMRDEGATLHPTKESAEAAYTKFRREGAYGDGGGYLGPVADKKPQEVRISWDLFDAIEASDRGYIHIEPREHEILTPL